jgi:hypothetical protein
LPRYRITVEFGLPENVMGLEELEGMVVAYGSTLLQAISDTLQLVGDMEGSVKLQQQES